MSISNLYPTIAPSLSLDFANVGALDPRITFVRTTTATYYGTETAKAEENLLLRSQEFDNAGWGEINTTVTANTEVAPDGTTTAETITDNVTNSSHRLRQLRTFIASTNFAVSAFLKKGTNDYGFIALQNDSFAQNYIVVVADLDAGTINAFNGTSATVVSSSITSVGNDWYRVSLVGSVANVTGDIGVNVGISDSANPTPSVFGSIAYAGTSTTIFAWGAQLEQRSTVTSYTPTTTQPITNFVPVLEVAAAGEARFDHNPLTFESLGLLVEEQRTNLVLRSEEFDNAAWTKTNSSITANTIVAPDGTLTGDKLIEDTANTQHFTRQNTTVTANTIHTTTLYVKAAERSLVRFGLLNSTLTSGAFAQFNLSTGAISGQTTTGTATNVSFSVTAVGNDWYRCSVTATVDSSSTIITPFIGVLDASGNASYTGDGFSGIFLWGAQLEQASFSTSYIQTVAATVTRNADAALMTGTNFSSWYRADEGSLYAEAAPAFSGAVLAINDNSNNNAINMFWTTNTNAQFQIRTNNTTEAGINKAASSPFKLIGAYQTNNAAGTVNADTVTTDTSVILPVVNQLRIGQTGAGINSTNGTIKKIAFYPARLSNAQLQALTTL